MLLKDLMGFVKEIEVGDQKVRVCPCKGDVVKEGGLHGDRKLEITVSCCDTKTSRVGVCGKSRCVGSKMH